MRSPASQQHTLCQNQASYPQQMEEPLCHSDTQQNGNQDWMSNLPARLWDVPLYNLSIPGSHDTMSYCLDKTSPISPEAPKVAFLLDQYVPSIVRNFIYKWSRTQYLSVKEQLDSGIRYMDLRIAIRPDDPSQNFYFVHGLYTSVTVEVILQDILRWLQIHPKEMLLLSCRDLIGIPPILYTHFIRIIHKILGPKLCPKNETPTLRNMWKQGYQVIVCDGSILQLVDEYLWPPIPYLWANTTSTRFLIHFLEKEKQNGRPVGFFTAGLNLTEDSLYILRHPFGSIRKLTLPKLQFLYKWVQNQHAGPQKDAINIIAEDLIGADNFVSAVINLNRKLLADP
ncbi:PI-PLC X domain-containing 1 [Pelobates cultripes]|uniref:PI-PLC X domain-containing 1 n=1 Tax=Pelobates cultripes TaxID=61616 RepID=A0AAD1R490_PELCU|nr:PI-PLC X domain-containing 1 [Pelobates cultripes]